MPRLSENRRNEEKTRHEVCAGMRFGDLSDLNIVRKQLQEELSRDFILPRKLTEVTKLEDLTTINENCPRFGVQSTLSPELPKNGARILPSKA